jgi:hypothetical protein
MGAETSEPVCVTLPFLARQTRLRDSTDMTSHELADALLDAIDDARRIPKRRIANGDLVGFRDDLQAWKESTRLRIRAEFGREQASRFEDIADIEILGPTWPYLEEAVSKYDAFLSALSDHVRSNGALPAGVPVTTTGRADRVIEAFCSYASKDESFRQQLDVHLAPLTRDRLIQVWNFRKLEPGVEWDAEIRKRLASAELVLPLVSPDFIASPYSWSQELEYALKRHEEGRARIVPIIIRESLWRDTPLGKLQALPADGKPVAAWPDRDAAWLNVAHGIRVVVDVLRAVVPHPSPASLIGSQREILEAFVERDIRAGEGFPINVLIGIRNLGPDLDALVEMGVVTIENRHFIRLTSLGERVAYDTDP